MTKAATQDSEAVGNNSRPITALAEVLLAFVLVHVSYRAFKHFTPLGKLEIAAGLNFSAGLTMILFTIGAALLFKRRFDQSGLTLKGGAYSLNVGLLWSVFVVLAAGALIQLAAIRFDPLHPPDMKKALIFTAAEIANTLLLLLWLRRERNLLKRISPIAGVLALVALLSIPLILASQFDRPLSQTLLSVLWLFFGAGFGEEFFFRGYVQSRINLAFGRPFRLLGVDWGWGVIVSAAFFGLIHVFNTVDYFNGRFDFAWIWWLPNFASGLFFGLLREKTKSVLAGGIVHGLTDVFSSVPALWLG